MKTEYSENELRYRRSLGVSRAWDREKELVRNGRGTREWTMKQQKELLDTGRVKGFQGHHMKSVSRYPQYADNPKNIQFLETRKNNNEHLKAHKGDYRNASDGRYNVKTGTIRPMNEDSPRAMYSHELKDKAISKRGYIKYASESARASTQGKGSVLKPQSKDSVEFNGKSYTRDFVKQSGTNSSRRYGQKMSQSGGKGRQTRNGGNYGQKTSKPSVSSQKSTSGGQTRTNSNYGQKASGRSAPSSSKGTSSQSSGSQKR